MHSWVLALRAMAPGTRDRILDAALRRFARHGFDGTTVTDIEADAGLAAGSGSFYRHFRSKDEVFDAVIEREVDRSAARNRALADTTPGADTRIALALEMERVLRGLQGLDPLIAILARERDRSPVLIEQVQRVMVEGGVEVNAELLGALDEVSPSVARRPVPAMSVVMSALVGYHLASRFFGGPPAGVSPADFITSLVDLLAPPSPER